MTPIQTTPDRVSPRKAVIAMMAASMFLMFAGCTGVNNSAQPTAVTKPVAAAGSGSSEAPDGLIESAIAQAEDGKSDEAKASFNRILATDPGNVFANYNLGVLAGMQGDNAGALDYYNAALATDPNYTSALYNKAIIMETTDLSQAIGIYEQIVGINPEASTTFMRLSLAHAERGESAKAAEMRRKALDLDPSLEDFVG